MTAHTTPVSGQAGRRRRTDQQNREKTSLSLRADVLQSAKEMVKSGRAENLSAFVETAIAEKITRTKRADLYAAYEMAAKDSAYLETIRTVTNEFDSADSDGL